MLERAVSLEINEAYAAVKKGFSEKGCKVISEQTPKQLLIKQGSLWGMSPKTAKKTLEINLTATDSGTKVTCQSRLSSDWKNLTLVGCAIAAVLVALCLWMDFDLGSAMAVRGRSFWSWIITVNGTIDLQVGQAFVNLTRALAAFLTLIILLEIAITVYVQRKIDQFAQQTLSSL